MKLITMDNTINQLTNHSDINVVRNIVDKNPIYDICTIWNRSSIMIGYNVVDKALPVIFKGYSKPIFNILKVLSILSKSRRENLAMNIDSDSFSLSLDFMYIMINDDGIHIAGNYSANDEHEFTTLSQAYKKLIFPRLKEYVKKHLDISLTDIDDFTPEHISLLEVVCI